MRVSRLEIMEGEPAAGAVDNRRPSRTYREKYATFVSAISTVKLEDAFTASKKVPYGKLVLVWIFLMTLLCGVTIHLFDPSVSFGDCLFLGVVRGRGRTGGWVSVWVFGRAGILRVPCGLGGAVGSRSGRSCIRVIRVQIVRP